MKHYFKKLLTVAAAFLLIFTTAVQPVDALASSKNYRTGYRSGQVIRQTYGVKGSGRTRARYISSKDIYVSEKVLLDQWAKDVTNWNDLSTVQNLSYNKSVTISATGSTDIIKAMGLKTSITVGKSSSAGGSHKPDPRRGTVGRLAIKCDYVVITYDHYTYNSNGRQTGRTRQTVKVPIPSTLVYYIRYKS